MESSTRVAYARGVRLGRAAARKSRAAIAPMDWHNLPSEEKAYRRGYARGIRDITRVRGSN